MLRQNIVGKNYCYNLKISEPDVCKDEYWSTAIISFYFLLAQWLPICLNSIDIISIACYGNQTA